MLDDEVETGAGLDADESAEHAKLAQPVDDANACRPCVGVCVALTPYDLARAQRRERALVRWRGADAMVKADEGAEVLGGRVAIWHCERHHPSRPMQPGVLRHAVELLLGGDLEDPLRRRAFHRDDPDAGHLDGWDCVEIEIDRDRRSRRGADSVGDR